MKYVAKELTETLDNSSGNRSLSFLLKNALYVAVVLVIGYILVIFTAIYLAGVIPDKWEAETFGKGDELLTASVGQQEATIFKDTDDLDFKRTKEIFEKILDQGASRELNYRLYYSSEPMANAFAVPGGHVIVTKGLLEMVESEEGLAFVLAHELGHHEKRHCLKRLSRTVSVGLVTAFLGGFDNASLVDSSVNISDLHYSRVQENEADEFAVEIIKKLYGNDEKCLEFFEKVAEDYTLPQWASFTQTHPHVEERLEHLKDLLKK